MGGRVKKENIKVENNNGSSYYMSNQDLKKLDFLDSIVKFVGDVRNCPAIFSIKYSNICYGSTVVYIISNDCNENTEKLGSLVKVKEFIARNILD